MAQNSVSVTFWEVRDHFGQRLPDQLPWGTWMDAIDDKSVDDRTVKVNNRNRLGMVWSPPEDADPANAMLVLGADRNVNPSSANYDTGEIETAEPDPGTSFAERVSGLIMPGNVLAAVSLGNAAPRPPSLLNYVVDICSLKDDGPDPIRLDPIPRPDLVAKLDEDGGLVTRLSFTTGLPGLQALSSDEHPSLLGVSWNPGTDEEDTPVNEMIFTVSAKIDTAARKHDTMGSRARASGRRLLKAAEKVVEGRNHVLDGEIMFLDENDKRHVVSLTEESLTTRWTLPAQQSASLGHDTVFSAIHEAYAHWSDHIESIVSGPIDAQEA